MTKDSPTLRCHEAVHSTWLGGDRGVTVYLPPGHEAGAGRRYPALILHDGQNLFDPDRAHIAGQHWRVAETADALIRAGRIEPLVIVGIDHGRDARVADFTPTPGARGDGGRAVRYARFVLDEILPWIAREYAVRTDANSLGMGGSSLGGLVTLAIAAAHPGRFSRLLVMSPSVWWDTRAILPILARSMAEGDHPARPLASRVWVDIGLKEGRAVIRDARRLRDVLTTGLAAAGRASGPPPAFRYVEDPAGDHSERSWARRFSEALEFLYDSGSQPASP